MTNINSLREIAKNISAHWLDGNDLTDDELEDLWIASEENKEDFERLIRARLHQYADDEMEGNK